MSWYEVPIYDTSVAGQPYYEYYLFILRHSLPYTFDFTNGYDKEALCAVGLPDNEPSDFDAFWQNLYLRTLQIPVNTERRTSTFTGAPYLR